MLFVLLSDFFSGLEQIPCPAFGFLTDGQGARPRYTMDFAFL